MIGDAPGSVSRCVPRFEGDSCGEWGGEAGGGRVPIRASTSDARMVRRKIRSEGLGCRGGGGGENEFSVTIKLT